MSASCRRSRTAAIGRDGGLCETSVNLNLAPLFPSVFHYFRLVLAKMSSDEETFLLLNYLRHRKRKRKNKRNLSNDYLDKTINRRFIADRELSSVDDSTFQEFYTMSKETFNELVTIVGPTIQKQNNNIQECVNADERIMITLRHLAVGCTFQALAAYFQRGESTVGVIVEKTTKAIWKTLEGPYMTLPNQERWKDVAKEFYRSCRLPNCLGAIGGMHIKRYSNPRSSRSEKWSPISLLACCDADGLFTAIKCEFVEPDSDEDVFRVSEFGSRLRSTDTLPPWSELPHDRSGNKFPYYFAASSDIPLMENIMSPYPEKNIDDKMRIFNGRLSRGGKIIESTFDMITKKFKVLATPRRCKKTETIVSTILAACVLHNFVRKKDGMSYTIPTSKNNQQDSKTLPDMKNFNIINDASPENLRNYLANYFSQPNVLLQ